MDKKLTTKKTSSDQSAPRLTPMMAQYLEIKNTVPDALLFYRMGDFYEMFFDDAVQAAAALDITLTRRGQHEGDDIPMCGVPFHAYEAYLARLIKAGFKVAICEQMEDPAEAKKRGAKSVVKREVVRLVTPGTLTEDTLLDARRHNYLAALATLPEGAALAALDLSTGDIVVHPVTAESFASLLAALAPSELVAMEADRSEAEAKGAWPEIIQSEADAQHGLCLTWQPKSLFNAQSAQRHIHEAYGVASLDGFGSFTKAEITALGVLIAYVSLTQVGKMPALKSPMRQSNSATMVIDAVTRASLELTQTQSGERKGSLLAAIDRSVTGSGARLLTSWLSAPLSDVTAISARQNMVAHFFEQANLREDCRAQLKTTPDIARALSRLTLGRGGPRDLANIRDGMMAAREMAVLLSSSQSEALIPEMENQLLQVMHLLDGQGKPQFTELLRELRKALSAELPMLARDGGFIARNYDPSLDETLALRDNARRIILKLEEQYRGETDIRSLKIKHNNVLGYFIDLTAVNAPPLMKLPLSEKFIHRQTLANNVRFTTVELSELDAKITRSRDTALAMELALYEKLVDLVKAQSALLSACSEALATIDCWASLAELAHEQNYIRPQIDDSLAFHIQAGRHPVVEQALQHQPGSKVPFIPNDCQLSDGKMPKLWLVTGPNMAGKSTFLRQNALIAILAQMGSFVPAKAAHIGVVDRLFSRVGASDDLARGRSTFMVEMVETSAILNQAGPRSLIVLDEIGRGTATYDGLSIAWAALEHLHDVNRSRGLFATHYHELTQLAARLKNLENVSVKVREWKGDVVFLHEVGSGPADRSYGVAVGRLAGLPRTVVARAGSILKSLEAGKGVAAHAELPLFDAVGSAELPEKFTAIEQSLTELEIDDLSPREALQILYDLKNRLKD